MDILALIRDRAGDYTCPICRRSLSGCDLTMLRDEDPLYTVQVACSLCKVSFMVVLQVRPEDGSITARPVTPASQRTEDRRRRRARRRLLARPPISADELLDLHDLLLDHDGPLTALLGPVVVPPGIPPSR